MFQISHTQDGLSVSPRRPGQQSSSSAGVGGPTGATTPQGITSAQVNEENTNQVQFKDSAHGMMQRREKRLASPRSLFIVLRDSSSMNDIGSFISQ